MNQDYMLWSSLRASQKRELFKRWVFHEVLPTIRRTGSYKDGEVAPHPLEKLDGDSSGVLIYINKQFNFYGESQPVSFTPSLSTLSKNQKVEKEVSAVKQVEGDLNTLFDEQAPLRARILQVLHYVNEPIILKRMQEYPGNYSLDEISLELSKLE